MEDIKFNEWQEMALKKDMESIIKKLDMQEPIILSLCWEVVLAVGTIIVDHLFDIQNIDIMLWIFVVILAVLPPIIIIFQKFVRWGLSIKKVLSGKYEVRDLVDTFDNQICYWVMMCNSYNNLLSKVSEKNKKIFLYQEGCYYNNKSMQALFHMNPVIDKVFSNDSKDVIEKNIVDIYRLLSLLEMMNNNQLELDKQIKAMKDDLIVKEQVSINQVYQKRIYEFVKSINKLFSIEVEWKKEL